LLATSRRRARPQAAHTAGQVRLGGHDASRIAARRVKAGLTRGKAGRARRVALDAVRRSSTGRNTVSFTDQGRRAYKTDYNCGPRRKEGLWRHGARGVLPTTDQDVDGKR